MNKVIGVFAHVDAGKTTLSEQLLYRAGAVRAPGRVDEKTSVLDAADVERQRGITVFSGQARFVFGGNTYYLLDTPGHADFTAEMERALRIIDFAVLVVSCAEGIQAHTETIWRMLRARGRARIPVPEQNGPGGRGPRPRIRRAARALFTGYLRTWTPALPRRC